MNLRKKAKKYKRELERIKAMPVQIAVITPRELRHLRIEKKVDPEFEYFCYLKKMDKDYIKEEVAKGLIDRLKYYVIHDPIKNTYTLDVWVKEDKE